MMSFPPRRLAPLFLCVTAIFAACDDDGPSGRGELPNLTGRWRYSATNLTSPQVTCSVDEMFIDLVQAAGSVDLDATFTGETFDFEIVCRRGQVEATLFFTEGAAVENGEIEGSSIAFDFSDPDFLHTGTILSDDRLSGLVATRIDLSETNLGDVDTVNLTGNWQAVRE